MDAGRIGWRRLETDPVHVVDRLRPAVRRFPRLEPGHPRYRGGDAFVLQGGRRPRRRRQFWGVRAEPPLIRHGSKVDSAIRQHHRLLPSRHVRIGTNNGCLGLVAIAADVCPAPLPQHRCVQQCAAVLPPEMPAGGELVNLCVAVTDLQGGRSDGILATRNRGAEDVVLAGSRGDIGHLGRVGLVPKFDCEAHEPTDQSPSGMMRSNVKS